MGCITCYSDETKKRSAKIIAVFSVIVFIIGLLACILGAMSRGYVDFEKWGMQDY